MTGEGSASELDQLLRRFYYRELVGMDYSEHPPAQGPTTDIVASLQRMMIATFFEELEAAVKEEMALVPVWKGSTGIRQIFDEGIDFWVKNPKQFTPSEFNKMWDSYTEDQKFNYVMGLIT